MTSTARVVFAAAALAAAFDGPPGTRAAAAQRPAAPPAVTRTGDGRHLAHAALEADLRTLATAHAGSASLVEMGRTSGGRRLWAIEIAAPGAAPPASRPGILLVANLAADQVAGSTLAIGIARALLTSSDDARLMQRADAQRGEAGGWAVYWEGVDSDGDGFVNEDGPGGVELDRNFPHQYPAYTAGAGRHMVSEEESRALLDYVLARRNIAAVVTFGATDTLVGGPQVGGGNTQAPATMDLAAFADGETTAALAVGFARDTPPVPYQPGGIFDDAFDQPAPRPPAPPSNATRPATAIESSDLEVFRHVSERYRDITGIRQLPPTRRAAGAFHEWAYFQFGVPGFSTPGASIPAVPASPAGDATDTAASGKPATPASPPAANGNGGPGADDGRWLSLIAGVRPDAFVAWTPFRHPTLGAVEIGGWRPFATVPPPAAVAPLVEPHVRFLVELSTFVPRVAIGSLTATRLGGGLCRIRADVENRGRWPTALQHAIAARAVKPVLVAIDVAPAAIVSGAPRHQFFPTLAGSGRRERVEWIVRAGSGQPVAVRVAAQKGGTATRTVRCE